MTLEQIKRELAVLPEQHQDHVVAYLVHLRHQRDSSTPQGLARKIEDQNATPWLSLGQLKEHWKD